MGDSLTRLVTALNAAEHFNEGRIDEMLDLADEGIQILSVPGVAPGPGCRGHDELRRYFADAARHNTRVQARIIRAEVTAAGNVLAVGDLLVTSGAGEQALPAWFVCRYTGTLLSSIETYLDADTAREQARADRQAG